MENYSSSSDNVLNYLSSYQLSHYKSLNDQQQRAFQEVADWSANDEDGYILIGAAGTGKTTTLRLIASFLPNAVLCAPTNKAVKELQKLNTSLDCCTIYSLLGLTMEEDEDSIKLKKSEKNRISQYDYVILDECGMVSKKLFKHIKEAFKKGIKFLFVGDPEQLPPVGEDWSRVWDHFNYSKLTKVMRHDNQILEFATHVRKLKRFKDLQLESNHDGQEGVWYLERQKFVKRIQKYAKNGYFDEETKALAWRNATVAELNGIVRQVIFGKKVQTSQYLVNDKVVFTKPYKSGDLRLFTDDEAIVQEVSVSKHSSYPFDCYYLTLQIDKRICTVKTLHEDSELYFQNMLAEYADEARQPKCGHLWERFWRLKKSMCYLKHSYALTVHRSQGSTYENVFVDVGDILLNRNKPEAKKCLYVASTRPSKRLFLT